MTLGNLVSQLRRRSGKTQAQVSVAGDVALSTLQKMESAEACQDYRLSTVRSVFGGLGDFELTLEVKVVGKREKWRITL